MKNFWHIQMNLGLINGSNLSQDQVLTMVRDKKIIGTGEWKDNKQDQCRQFKESMRIGDIVMVRNGIQPLALVEIVSNSYPNRTYENERSINVLSLFNEEISKKTGKYKGQAQGTLTIVQNKNSPTAKFIFSWYNSIIKYKEMDSFLNLIKYKKQIILQGPPGTGKTRLAKKIAMDLCQSQELTADYVMSFFQPGMIVRSSSGQKEYTVISIKENAINVKLTTGSSYDIPIKDIIKAYKTELWKGGQVSGNDPYRAALAKYISEHFNSGEYKIIQFHPAYSYDDFVRGIVVDTTNGDVSYRSINKVFGELSAKAWQNYQDSKKTAEQLSEEQKVDQFIDLFRDYLEDEIESKGGKLFLEGTTTYLFQVDEDAVRYTGDNWKLITGQRLLFSDIKKLYLSGVYTRQEIKATPNISGLGKHHSSYFLRVLNLFKDFVKGKTVSVPESNSVSEKNYVLIIDEINRANLPSVLGELIYGLEYRGEPVESMYEVKGDRSIIIPPNLYIIGTMNTADRSVGHIDYAIRRRFAFVDVLPTIEPVKNELAKEYFKLVSELFVSNYEEVMSSKATPIRSACLSSDFGPEQVWIGHSYFITHQDGEKGDVEIRTKMKYEVLPLIKEYVKDGILNSDEKNADDPVQKVIYKLWAL